MTAPAIAQKLVAARRAGAALAAFPGPIPVNLALAYECQNIAIDLWPDAIAGWKVGRVADELVNVLGADRVIGAIFARNVWPAAALTTFPVIVGGFAAVEAEFVYRLRADAPADKTSWTIDEALDLVGSMHIGVEIAGSPLPDINELGPTVVAADFGNNSGLILGRAVEDWRGRPIESLRCETEIDTVMVGAGDASSLPGGPPMALAFALARCAALGRPIRAGGLVSTGAVTGVHDIKPGQRARVTFSGLGVIECEAAPLRNTDRDQEKGVGL